MSYSEKLDNASVGVVIDHLLSLPPHCRKYTFKAVGGFVTKSDPTIYLIVDDAAESVEVVSCKPAPTR